MMRSYKPRSGAKGALRPIEVVASASDRTENPFVYEIAQGKIRWGDDWKRAKLFKSTTDALKQLGAVSGVDPEKFIFVSPTIGIG